MQPEAEELTPMGEEEMRLFAKRIEETGIKVSVSR
jgi:hypothetical protein